MFFDLTVKTIFGVQEQERLTNLLLNQFRLILEGNKLIIQAEIEREKIRTNAARRKVENMMKEEEKKETFGISRKGESS